MLVLFWFGFGLSRISWIDRYSIIVAKVEFRSVSKRFFFSVVFYSLLGAFLSIFRFHMIFIWNLELNWFDSFHSDLSRCNRSVRFYFLVEFISMFHSIRVLFYLTNVIIDCHKNRYDSRYCYLTIIDNALFPIDSIQFTNQLQFIFDSIFSFDFILL